MVVILSGKHCVRVKNKVLQKTSNGSGNLLCGQSWGAEVWVRFVGQVGPLWDCYPWNMQCSDPGLRFGADDSI